MPFSVKSTNDFPDMPKSAQKEIGIKRLSGSVLQELRQQCKILQRQPLAPHVGGQAARNDGGLDHLLTGARQGGGQAVHQGLPPQQEGAFDDLEEKGLVGRLHGGPFPPDAPQHGGGHLGGGQKLLPGHLKQQLRLHIVL